MRHLPRPSFRRNPPTRPSREARRGLRPCRPYPPSCGPADPRGAERPRGARRRHPGGAGPRDAARPPGEVDRCGAAAPRARIPSPAGGIVAGLRLRRRTPRLGRPRRLDGVRSGSASARRFEPRTGSRPPGSCPGWLGGAPCRSAGEGRDWTEEPDRGRDACDTHDRPVLLSQAPGHIGPTEKTVLDQQVECFDRASVPTPRAAGPGKTRPRTGRICRPARLAEPASDRYRRALAPPVRRLERRLWTERC